MQRSRPAISSVVLLLILLVFLVSCGTQTGSAGTATTGPPQTTPAADSTSPETAFVQQEGEIFLEAAGAAGPESLPGETFVSAGPAPTLNIPTTTIPATTIPTATVPSATTVAGAVVISYPGDIPALYGGSKSKELADKEGQVSFFEQNADKAAAFCAALNSDETFDWSGGDQVHPDQLRDYFAELTPLDAHPRHQGHQPRLPRRAADSAPIGPAGRTAGAGRPLRGPPGEM